MPAAAQTRPALNTQARQERAQARDLAQKALMDRPRFNYRLQIFLGFFLAFLFAFAIATSLVVTIYLVENKIKLLNIVNDYFMEIQQARRFEKNFFLYGTNLSDALEQVSQAKIVLENNSEELKQVMGEKSLAVIVPHLQRYEELLGKLEALERSGSGPEVPRKAKELEPEVRSHGQEVVSFAQDLMRREKASLEQLMARSRLIHIYAFVVASIFMIYIAYILGSRMLGTVKRFSSYAKRIAAGDFTPITPTRRYRDEFTDLAVTLNQMMQDLEAHEAVLVQSHKMRAVGTLTAGVAHELNNPLNNITLTAHALMEDYQDLSDEDRQDMLNDLVAEAGRARGIISNLLDFARESGSQVEPLDMVTLLQDTIHLAANQIRLSGIKTEFSASDNLPRVHGDSQQLRQVFLNLILNAMDASPKGGKIQIMVLPADDGNYLAVKVIDYGSGIPEHVLASIFDPFFTTKPTGKGTGLGLSMSQGIVTKHGGRINVSSREGQGTTFTVLLPVTTIPADIGRS